MLHHSFLRQGRDQFSGNRLTQLRLSDPHSLYHRVTRARQAPLCIFRLSFYRHALFQIPFRKWTHQSGQFLPTCAPQQVRAPPIVQPAQARLSLVPPATALASSCFFTPAVATQCDKWAAATLLAKKRFAVSCGEAVARGCVSCRDIRGGGGRRAVATCGRPTRLSGFHSFVSWPKHGLVRRPAPDFTCHPGLHDIL